MSAMFCMYGGKGNDADPEMFGQSVDRTGVGRQRDTGGQKEEESARGRRRSGRFGSGLDSGAPVVKQIGDCIRPANICMAVYQGYHAALDI